MRHNWRIFAETPRFRLKKSLLVSNPRLLYPSIGRICPPTWLCHAHVCQIHGYTKLVTRHVCQIHGHCKRGARPNPPVSWAHQDGFLPKTARFPGVLRFSPRIRGSWPQKSAGNARGCHCAPCVPWRLKRVPFGGVGELSEFSVGTEGGSGAVANPALQGSRWVVDRDSYRAGNDGLAIFVNSSMIQ